MPAIHYSKMAYLEPGMATRGRVLLQRSVNMRALPVSAPHLAHSVWEAFHAILIKRVRPRAHMRGRRVVHGCSISRMSFMRHREPLPRAINLVQSGCLLALLPARLWAVWRQCRGYLKGYNEVDLLTMKIYN